MVTKFYDTSERTTVGGNFTKKNEKKQRISAAEVVENEWWWSQNCNLKKWPFTIAAKWLRSMKRECKVLNVSNRSQ